MTDGSDLILRGVPRMKRVPLYGRRLIQSKPHKEETTRRSWKVSVYDPKIAQQPLLGSALVIMLVPRKDVGRRNLTGWLTCVVLRFKLPSLHGELGAGCRGNRSKPTDFQILATKLNYVVWYHVSYR